MFGIPDASRARTTPNLLYNGFDYRQTMGDVQITYETALSRLLSSLEACLVCRTR